MIKRDTPEMIAKYATLERKFYTLRAIDPKKRDQDAFKAIVDQLAEIDATAPDGYSLPAAAQKLIECTTAHGWRYSIQWTPPGYVGSPFVRVQVGRLGDETGNWTIQYTWHSRDCEPGRVRLFGKGTMTSPGHQSPYSAPSVTTAMKMIAENPVTGESC